MRVNVNFCSWTEKQKTVVREGQIKKKQSFITLVIGFFLEEVTCPC